MGLATVLSRAQRGMQAPLVSVEVDTAGGLPTFTIVGLPEAVVKESRDRVRSALGNCNLAVPGGRITVNLAPAELPKEGGRFDLPIALGILAATDQVPTRQLAGCEFYGELSLSGELRPVRGALPAALFAARMGHRVIVPQDNADEARLVRDCPVAGVNHLTGVCSHLAGNAPLEFVRGAPRDRSLPSGPDLAEVRGQPHAKRALEIAAAGQHSLLYIGPPGTGKSMLAQRLPGLLPPLTEDEALEVATVRSLTTFGLDVSSWRQRPFRTPHHTASAVAMIGGGTWPRPGEVSLAHRGVLFLDELPEFERRVLEVLREPLETGSVNVSRAAFQAEFPADFQLIAAMNPCPCGHLGDSRGRCRCTADQIQRYRARISGPLLDRLDLHVEVPRLPATCLTAEIDATAEPSTVVAERVAAARERQLARQQCSNARLGPTAVRAHCRLDAAGQQILEAAVTRFGLSARSFHRILKLARTIADLAGTGPILTAHLGEALALRCLDRAGPLA
jgi:magnesium chelatase family protein